ncbi:MAG: exodeoxyribonuclease VII large subunit [Tissierellia bacterium]|nr:exodeoxyribonuclease VII large subunit [Tissierellia bacterium]
MTNKPLKVSEVNQYIKRLLSSDWILSNLKVEGEISNFKYHYSGHIYFSLKDEKGKIKCVMFRSYAENLDINIQDGDKVIVTGYISVYEKEGNYQLYATNIEKSGLGELYIAFEKLKAKLESEGLFDPINKKQLPAFPRKIGIVTSSTGAAIRDIITVIKRRFPIVDILIYPALVQGVYAVDSICQGLNYLNGREDIDLIIVGRGGGSFEELFSFNDEKIARTIFSLEKPVVSAVGHETDFTIADFVADLRAPTPSAAAEMVTPERSKLLEQLEENLDRLIMAMRSIVDNNKSKMDLIFSELRYNSPINRVRDMMQQQDNLFKRLVLAINYTLRSKRDTLDNLYNSLSYLNPLYCLERGYGILMDSDGNIITSIDSLDKNEEFNIMLKDGIVKAKVVNINKGELNYEKN